MRIIKIDGGKSLAFECPGCGENHLVTVDGSRGWSWNGKQDLPTITPSILAQGFRFTKTEPSESEPYTCHSFVIDGRIQFLGDCTHALAGQTVDLPEVSK